VIRIHILGSGTFVPYTRRSSPSNAIEINQQLCLVDCGSGTLKRIADAGLNFRDIRLLFFTHSHIDHTGDLVSLLFALKNIQDLPTDYDLTIFGPNGFNTYVNSLLSAHDPWLTDLPFSLEVRELNNQTVSFNKWNVTTKIVEHSFSAIGFRFEYADKVVTFSGDTDYCRAIIDLCRNSNLAVLECSTPDEQKAQGHLTPSLVAKVAQQAGCEKIVLTHLYPPCDEIDIIAVVKETFEGEVIIGEDLKRFDI